MHGGLNRRGFGYGIASALSVLGAAGSLSVGSASAGSSYGSGRSRSFLAFDRLHCCLDSRVRGAILKRGCNSIHG